MVIRWTWGEEKLHYEFLQQIFNGGEGGPRGRARPEPGRCGACWKRYTGTVSNHAKVCEFRPFYINTKTGERSEFYV